MKKTVLICGVISGEISLLMILGQMSFIDRIGFDKGEILGYTIMVLSFLMIFAGVRSYRDKQNNGTITFGRALGMGILITLVSCACYAATWEIVYFNVSSGRQFMKKYGEYMVSQAKASGASDAAILKQVEEVEKFKQLYENPLFNAAVTFVEPLPVGLIMSLISAATLRRKQQT